MGALGLLPGAGLLSIGRLSSSLGVVSPGTELVESGGPGISLGVGASVGVVASGTADGGGIGASFGERSTVFFVQAKPPRTVEPIKAESSINFFTTDTPMWLAAMKQ